MGIESTDGINGKIGPVFVPLEVNFTEASRDLRGKWKK